MATKTIKSVESKADQTSAPFNLGAWFGKAFKRLFDILVSGLCLLFLSPVIGLIALVVKRESPGPVFYRGPRLGRGGTVFNILKFRTMRESPESYLGPRITAKDDPRITPLGKWLRDTKINELPQLWNVLRGEMSLVGPRPEEPEIAAHWTEAARQEILSVRPGITSPASVLYRDEEKLLTSGNVMDDYLRRIMPDKQRLDLLYVRTHRFFSDLDVIFLTLISLFPSADGRPIPEGSLFSGLLANFIRRHVSWFLVDTLITFFAMGIAGLAWRLVEPLNVGWGPAILLALGFALLKSVTAALMGVNRIAWSRASASDALELLPGILVATIIALLVNYFWPAGLLGIATTGAKTPWGSDALLPTGLFLTAAGLAFVGIVAVRYRQRLVTGVASRWLQLRHQTSALGERLLIVGAGECGQLAGWLVQKSNLASAFIVVGMVDDDPHKYNMRIDGHPVLGSTRDLPALVERDNIGVILYAISHIDPPEQERILALCRSLPVRLVVVPDLIKILQDYLLPNDEMIKPRSREARKENKKVN
jgi:lipopolysaccharide/colanic/teichoic acid biosynthesis glycosyltransferase